MRRQSICQPGDVVTGQSDAQTHTIATKTGAERESSRNTHTEAKSSLPGGLIMAGQDVEGPW